MIYKPGDYIQVSESKSVRLNKDTAEIANGVVADLDERIEATLWRHEHFLPGTFSLPSGAVARDADSFLTAALGANDDSR